MGPKTEDSMKNSSEVQQAIQTIVDRIVKEYTPEEIILFGSYAYGQPNQDSDLDFFIVKDTEKPPLRRRIELRRLLRDDHRRLPLELIVLTPEELDKRLRLRDQFIQEIIDRGKVLYER